MMFRAYFISKRIGWYSQLMLPSATLLQENDLIHQSTINRVLRGMARTIAHTPNNILRL